MTEPTPPPDFFELYQTVLARRSQMMDAIAALNVAAIDGKMPYEDAARAINRIVKDEVQGEATASPPRWTTAQREHIAMFEARAIAAETRACAADATLDGLGVPPGKLFERVGALSTRLTEVTEHAERLQRSQDAAEAVLNDFKIEGTTITNRIVKLHEALVEAQQDAAGHERTSEVQDRTLTGWIDQATKVADILGQQLGEQIEPNKLEAAVDKVCRLVPDQRAAKSPDKALRREIFARVATQRIVEETGRYRPVSVVFEMADDYARKYADYEVNGAPPEHP